MVVNCTVTCIVIVISMIPRISIISIVIGILLVLVVVLVVPGLEVPSLHLGSTSYLASARARV